MSQSLEGWEVGMLNLAKRALTELIGDFRRAVRRYVKKPTFANRYEVNRCYKEIEYSTFT